MAQNLIPQFSTISRDLSAVARNLEEGHLPSNGFSLDDFAHELRQPLSTIESIAYYLELVLSKDPNACTHLRKIQEMINQANGILEKALIQNNALQEEDSPLS